MRRNSNYKNSVYCQQSEQIIHNMDSLSFEDKQSKLKQTINSLVQENKRLKQLVHFKEHTLEPKQSLVVNKRIDSHPNLGMKSSQNNHQNGRFYIQQSHSAKVSEAQEIANTVYVTGTMKSIAKRGRKQMEESDSSKILKFQHTSIKHLRLGTNAESIQQQFSRVSQQFQNSNHEEEREHSISQQTKTPEPSFSSFKKLIGNHFKQVFKGKSEVQIESHYEKIIQEIKKQMTPINSVHRLYNDNQQKATSKINVQGHFQSKTSFNNMQTPKKSTKVFSSNSIVRCSEKQNGSAQKYSENTIEMMNSNINSQSENMYFGLNQNIINEIQNFVAMVKKNAFQKSQQKNRILIAQVQANEKSSNTWLKEKKSEESLQLQMGDLNIQASLKNIENSLKNCKTNPINDKQNQSFLPKQSYFQASASCKPRKHGHFRGMSYTDKQPAQLRYSEDQTIVKNYYNNSCLSTPFNGSKIQQSKLKDMSKKHPIQPNTEWTITPQNRVYTQKWKIIAEKSLNPLAKRNNSIRNSPYV